MKKNSLAVNGLSLSQAQSISNLCNQRASEISGMISGLNNATKTLKIGNESYIETVGKPIPGNIVELLKEKASLHATQAFLMENIKAKEILLNNKKSEVFKSSLIAPVRPKFIEYDLLEEVDENWGWEQLTLNEINEFHEVEAYAAHFGQFIHKDGPLDLLRKQLNTMKTLEWITVKDGEKTPLKIDIHHESKDLLAIHEELAAIHRKYEQRVNYFKAKVKNLVTIENARIAKENANAQESANSQNTILFSAYNNDYELYMKEALKEKHEFEAKRQESIKEIAQMRIAVDARFQPIVDVFLKQLEDKTVEE